MFQAILRSQVQEFITENLRSDLHSLLLQKSPFEGLSMSDIVRQIKGRQVAEKKFPFLNVPSIIYPPHLNLEQSSSQSTAEYKKNLFRGKTFADITCGFGIDSYFLSQNFQQTTLVEQDEELLQIVKHNWSVLNKPATFIHQKAEDFLESSPLVDLIYLDPARRNEQQKKVFLLEDLSPNILELKTQLIKSAEQVLIKLSPLIDITYLTAVLPKLLEIHIVAVKNEVKEVLVLLKRENHEKKIKIKCVNLETQEPEFAFYFDELMHAEATYSEPQNYLYIPNSSILKSGAFQLVAKRYGLYKLHPNTHFYTSKERVGCFPGRVLPIEVISAKDIKKGARYNIVSKNHPLKPADIKKKYQLKDGGEHYLIFTQSNNRKIIIRSI